MRDTVAVVVVVVVVFVVLVNFRSSYAQVEYLAQHVAVSSTCSLWSIIDCKSTFVCVYVCTIRTYVRAHMFVCRN